MDATDQTGAALPGSGELANAFVQDFSIPADVNELSLSAAYEEAVLRTSSDGLDLSSYLEKRLTRCRPAKWHGFIPSMNWKRIWTLNIDDVLEQSYQLSHERRQRHISVDWTSPHDDAPPTDVQIVHLHGRAWGGTRLVFSIPEYLQATSELHTWHRIFGDHFQDQPFIIVGARLADEFDLASILRRGSSSWKSRGQPSYVILRSIRPVQYQQFQRANLIPIEMPAAGFFQGLHAAVAVAERKMAAFVPGRPSSGAIDNRARTFLNQFGWLSVDQAPKENNRDFYSGFDPEWQDILKDNDAIFEAVPEVVGSITVGLNDPGAVQQLELLHGPWGTGKSTALLRIAREIVKLGLDAYLFRAETRPDVEAVLWWLTGSPKTLLLFDGIADHADDVSELLDRAKRASVRVMIVGTEREKRIRQIMNSTAPEFLRYQGKRQMRTMSKGDINVLLKKLADKSRLGRLTRRRIDQQQLHFARDAKGQLFVGMSRLESGSGFMQRFSREVRGEQLDGQAKALLGLTGLTHHFGYPLPVSIASAATGLSTPVILDRIVSGDLQELMLLKPQGLQLRHRHLASMLVREILPMSEKYRLSMQLAQNIAPHADLVAVEQRSLPHKITKNLLDHNSVRIWAGRRAPEWYGSLEELFGWNARFWEQRALALVRMDDLPQARSFAEKAVKIHKDIFTMTTLGNIALRQVVASLEAGEKAIIDDYWEAVSLLREARDNRQTADDHSFSVFFNQSIRIADLLLKTDGIPDDMVGEVNDWFAEARRNPTFDYPENRKRLQRFQTEWWRLLTQRT
jgi:DNA polymerase III delta prime subunit